MEYCYKYPRPALTADSVVLASVAEVWSVLLIERGNEPFRGHWALPGGFMQMNETLEECAMRELKEETNVEVSSLRQVGCFSDVDRDPRERVVTVAFYVFVDNRELQVRAGDDAAMARWYPLDCLPKLAFDHKKILKATLEKIKEDFSQDSRKKEVFHLITRAEIENLLSMALL